MRRRQTPQWILKYKRKITTMRFFGAVLFSLGFYILQALQMIEGGDFTFFAQLILVSSLGESILMMIFGLPMLVGVAIKYIRVDEYYICHYVGWKNRLIIDGEEEDSSVLGKCYGTLPDGREVTSGGLLRISIKVYDPTKHRTRKY